MLSPNAAIDDWVADEFRSVDFGDPRLDNRFKVMLTAMFKRPSGSVPISAGDWAGTKASYRFVHNPAIDLDNVPEAHVEQTLRRASSQSAEAVILAVQDTTQLDFTSHGATKGLGALQPQVCRGLLLHSTLAVGENGEVHGVLDQRLWARPVEEFGKRHRRKERAIVEKESNKWLVSLQATASFGDLLPQALIVHVADREADLYDLFVAGRPDQQHILVRAHHNRALAAEEQKLWPFLKEQPLQGEVVVDVPGGHGKKPRKATLTLRFAEVALRRPRTRPKEYAPSVKVWAVLAQEESSPLKSSEIAWLLLSTLPVNSAQEAARRVRWYTCRWRVEMFHRILKSGCCVESCRLADAESLKRYLIMESLVAWRVLYCTTTGREHPDWPCSVILEETEWKALYCYIHKTHQPPKEPPKLADAVRWIARLGGFLARKGDGHPGAQTIQAGFERLSDFVVAYTIFRGQPAKLVGN